MSSARVFLTVEVGTTGARAVALDALGHVVAEVRHPYPTFSPRPGWAEQDALAWRDGAVACLAELSSRIDASRVGAIGLTGQTPTVVPVDTDCNPLRSGMLYRDNRATLEASEMIARLGADRLHAITGHTPAAFHVGPKILWLRRHEPDLFTQTRWFLQPRDVVLHALTGRVATDESHANATALFDLERRCWSSEILDSLDLQPGRLPEVVAPASVVALLRPATARAVGLPHGVPIVIGAGDSQCAAFGSSVTEPGPVSEMAGSSSCINSAVGKPIADLRITHYSHVVPNMFTTEVGLNTTGAAIRWAVHNLGFRTYQRLACEAQHARSSLTAGGSSEALGLAPFFVPHLGDGERSDVHAPSGFFALSERHNQSSLAYAVLEGVAAAVVSEVNVLAAAGCPVDELRVAGGGTRLGALGQAKADMLGAPVLHLDVDTSALGAAMLAARSAGFEAEASGALEQALSRAARFEPDCEFADVAHARFEQYRSYA